MTAEYIFTLTSGEEIPVIIETKRGCRNIILRPITGIKREIHISKPWTTTTASAIRFLNQKSQWVERIMDRAPKKIKIAPGDVIEFLGKKVRILHDPSKRSNTYLPPKEGDEIQTLIIGGAPEMLERRIRDLIKDELLKEIKKIVKSTPADYWPQRIVLRDTSSRWGSCSTTGTTSFSWRLAFAPYDVMRYVVMHELAHKKYMDHSDHFWATVAQLYGDGVGRAKRWLTINGTSLYQYF